MLCYFLLYSKVTQLYIYICILLHILFHYSLLQYIEYTFLCYTRMIFIKWSFIYISVPNRETRMEFYSCKLVSPIQWTWTCANSGRCWGTRRPGVLQSMGLQRVGQDWVTEQQYSRDFGSWTIIPHIWLFSQYFKFFHYHYLCWFLTSDLWCYYYNLLKAQMMVSIFFSIKAFFKKSYTLFF